MAGQPGFFDIEERLRELSSKGDDLERLKRLVDFELFRADLEKAFSRGDRSKGGGPPFDHVLMFKVLILQTMHSLSDERCEYLIKDRLSFMRFLGLGLADPVPDANTIWTFREALTKAGAIEVLFRRFDKALKMSGYLAMGAADRRRHDCGRAQAAQYGRGEEGDQGRTCSGRMEGQACQARPEGSRRALDGQILQSQAASRMACRTWISPFPLSDTRTTSRSIAAMD